MRLLISFKSSSLSTAETSSFFFDHERVIADRLDFQIIVEVHETRNRRIRLAAQDCLVEFARLAGEIRSSDRPGISGRRSLAASAGGCSISGGIPTRGGTD